MGLNEVGYEGNCQVWATVGNPPSITSSSSSSSSYFLHLKIVQDIQVIYIVVVHTFKATMHYFLNGKNKCQIAVCPNTNTTCIYAVFVIS